MQKPLSLFALLLAAALLLGCDDATEQTTGPEHTGNDPLEGVADASPEDLRIDAVSKGWRPPTIDADGITELREQTASQGKVLVIDCWATWCSSCVAMFPHLHEAMKERGDDVVLASLSFDEGDAAIRKAAQFLSDQKAMDHAYVAAPGSDATAAISDALSDDWGGTILPAVFVYKPDGTIAYEMLETRGEVDDWVAEITAAVDSALQDADESTGR